MVVQQLVRLKQVSLVMEEALELVNLNAEMELK